MQPSTTALPGRAIHVMGTLADEERRMLLDALEASRARHADEWPARRAAGEIFWLNVWQRTDGASIRDLPLDRWVRQLIARYYRDEAVLLDGYGFVLNPAGSRTQAWHLDYSEHYSNLLVPITPLTPQNATQYIALPASLPEHVYRRAIADTDVVDVPLLEAHGATIAQLAAEQFAIVKMDFGTVHRGIANRGSDDRAMFYVSVRRPGASSTSEPLFQTFEK
ncbi:MAG: hypothetical protein HY261_09005 [Chloroflexi bacterium]|nr:hypothetical protein [Chloroflexota bacterium]